jgi:hypothetical protein
MGKKKDPSNDAKNTDVLVVGPVESALAWNFEEVVTENGPMPRFIALRRFEGAELATALAATLTAVAMMKNSDRKKVLKMFEAASAGERFVSIVKEGKYYVCQADDEMSAAMQDAERALEGL